MYFFKNISFISFYWLLFTISCLDLEKDYLFGYEKSKIDTYDFSITSLNTIDSSAWDTCLIKNYDIYATGLWVSGKKDVNDEFNNFVVLFFNGSETNLHNSAEVGKAFHDIGVNFMSIEYRGFGTSKFKKHPTEETLLQDGKVAIDYLLNTKNYLLSNIIIFGYSIGSIIATDVAKSYNPRGLILAAGISDGNTMAEEMAGGFSISSNWLMNARLDNLSKIDQVNCPTCFICSNNDMVTPCNHSEKLFNKAKEPKYIYYNDEFMHGDLLVVDTKWWTTIVIDFIRSLN